MTTSALCLLVAMAAVQLDAASKPEHSLCKLASVSRWSQVPFCRVKLFMVGLLQ